MIVPRDLCFLSKEGKLNNTGRPVYQIERIFPPESIKLNTNRKKSRIYHNIYQKVFDKYFE